MKSLDRLIGKSQEGAVVLFAEECEKALSHEQHILFAFPEWRQCNPENIQPVEEVFSKPALFYRKIQV